MACTEPKVNSLSESGIPRGADQIALKAAKGTPVLTRCISPGWLQPERATTSPSIILRILEINQFGALFPAKQVAVHWDFSDSRTASRRSESAITGRISHSAASSVALLLPLELGWRRGLSFIVCIIAIPSSHNHVGPTHHSSLEDVSKYDRGLLTVGKPPQAVYIEGC